MPKELQGPVLDMLLSWDNYSTVNDCLFDLEFRPEMTRCCLSIRFCYRFQLMFDPKMPKRNPKALY